MIQHNSTRSKMVQEQKHWKTHGGVCVFWPRGSCQRWSRLRLLVFSLWKISTRYNINQDKPTWFNITQHESRWSKSKNIEKRMEGSAFFGNGALAKDDLVYVFLCSRFWKISTRYNINQDKSTWLNITQHETRWPNNKNIEKRMEGLRFLAMGLLPQMISSTSSCVLAFEKY